MTKFITPFSLDIEPMSRLLLVNFEKDPDTIYKGFEPQVFDDAEHGKGHLVIGWRNDGKVDVYHEPSLKLNPKGYDIVGKGLANMVAREMNHALFLVKNEGVQAHFLFKDMLDREVEIMINESNPKKREPFGLLAPMGHVAENPSSLPLILLCDFYFVRQQHTEFKVSIDGVYRKLDKLPIPMDFTKMYFTRYSSKPIIARLNPAFGGALKVLEVKTGIKNIDFGEYDINLVWNGENALFKRITRRNEIHPIHLDFDDPFPNLYAWEGNSNLSGKFRIVSHPSIGEIAGEYLVSKLDDKIKITMVPNKGWKPKYTKFSLRFLYNVVSIFKQWPKTYAWTAEVHQNNNDQYFMDSDWKRIK
jgi:hypothetical protein